MKGKIYLITVLLCLFGVSLGEDGHEITNKRLLDFCESQPNSSAEMFCIGYIRGASQQRFVAGVMTAVNLQMMYKKLAGSEINTELLTGLQLEAMHQFYGCLGNLTTEQVIAVYVKWVKANPERWHESAHFGISRALSSSFPPPCD